MIEVIRIADRGEAKWDTYKVSTQDDHRRVEIARLADLEGRSSIAVLIGLMVGSLGHLAQPTPQNLSTWGEIGLLQVIVIASLFLACFFVCTFLFYRKKRRQVIRTISDETAYLQIRHILSFRADPDVYMFGEIGIYYNKTKQRK